MAVNYNILNKITDKYVDKKLEEKMEECYYCIFYPSYNTVQQIRISIIKDVSSKYEAYLKIMKNDFLIMTYFLFYDEDIAKIALPKHIFEGIQNNVIQPQKIYEELKSYIPDIDEKIIKYMTFLSRGYYGRYLVVGKLNELKKIE